MISVIIPVYNLESELKRCVDSVLGQTFSDFEIILVDDGSVDGSGCLCDTYAGQYDNVFVIHQKNAGLSAARNRGIEAAKGQYIAFVDGDDLLHPYFLERLYGLIEKHGADIAVCGYKRMLPEEGNPFIMTETREDREMIFSGRKAFESRAMVRQAAWNKLYHRRIFTKEKFTEGILHEDVDSYYRFLLAARKVVYTSEPLYGYLVRPGSLSDGMSPRRYRDWAKAAYRMLKYMQSLHWQEGCYHAMEENSEFYCLAYFQWKDVYGSKTVADRIHKKYRRLLRENRTIRIPYRYRLFYFMPQLFYVYMKHREPGWYKEVVWGNTGTDV